MKSLTLALSGTLENYVMSMIFIKIGSAELHGRLSVSPISLISDDTRKKGIEKNVGKQMAFVKLSIIIEIA